jgi:hypothetical protein
MNHVLIFIGMFWIVSCNEKAQSKLKADVDTSEIRLIDSLGSITINKPDQSDTLLTWIKRSDCGKSCEEGMYRFQPKALPIFKESGFYWIGQPEDSVNQLTISHHRPEILLRNRETFAIEEYNRFKENLESDPETTNIITDTIQKIGDRYFCIFKIVDVDKKRGVLIRRLVAFTSISGNELQFHYDLLTKKRDSILNFFFINSMENLQSVRIKDGS